MEIPTDCPICHYELIDIQTNILRSPGEHRMCNSPSTILFYDEPMSHFCFAYKNNQVTEIMVFIKDGYFNINYLWHTADGAVIGQDRTSVFIERRYSYNYDFAIEINENINNFAQNLLILQ